MKKIICLFIVLFIAPFSFADQVGRIDKDQLKSKLNSKEVVVLDARSGRDWSTSEFKIKGAVRFDGKDFSTLSKFTKNHTFVLYCA